MGSYSFPAIAQHHASKQKAEKPKTDAELIASAISAAPSSISKDATVMAVGSDGKLRTLRQGQGAFTCVPDDPNTPGNDPMCLDRYALEWFKALLAHEKPPEGKVWLAYMLKAAQMRAMTTLSQANRKQARNGCKQDRT
jgi:hypothetical protein